MRNERKKYIPALGWIIGALLLIYLGVFCYLNLCKYAQHVDSDIAAEALLAREIWVEKDITPNDWISKARRDGSLECLRLQPYFTVSPAACRRRRGLPAFYWVRFCFGDILFFSEKIIFEQTGINYGIAWYCVRCQSTVFAMRGRWFLL